MQIHESGHVVYLAIDDDPLVARVGQRFRREATRATHQVAGLVMLVVRSDGMILTECGTHLCDLLPGQQLELF